MVRSLCLIVSSALLGLLPSAQEDLRHTPVVRVVERTKPAVVSITTDKPGRRWTLFGYQDIVQETRGTGAIIFDDGYIVTNNHVVDGASRIVVSFDPADDERVYEARLVSAVPDEDLALLKIDGRSSFPTIVLSDDEPILGEPVVAIGNAFGNSHTVSSGIISGLHRNIEASGMAFTNLIQTDAAINPGNSGGPLLNLEGELIGINTAVTGAAENIGFAIPVARVKYVLSEHLLSLDQARSWLGFRVDDDFRVTRVFEGSPADEAGLQPGDRILSIDGRRITDQESYRLARLGVAPSSTVRIALLRGDREREVELVAMNKVDGIIYEHVGIFAQMIRLGRSFRPYLQVTGVDPGGPAAEIGIRPGDVLAAVRPEGWGPKSLRSLADLAWLVSGLEPGTPLDIEIWRDDDEDGVFERDADYSELYEGRLTLR